MKSLYQCGLMVVCCFFSIKTIAQSHVNTTSLLLVNGTNTITLVPASLTADRVFIFPDQSGTVLTTTSLSNSAWALGGNTNTGSNNQIGTLDAINLKFITGSSGPNTRMEIGATGGIGISAAPSASVRLAIGLVGNAEDALDLSSTANGNGTGIRLGGTAGFGFNTGLNITGGTGILYNGLNAGSGTGMRIGGTVRPDKGVQAEGNTYGLSGRALTAGTGVIGTSILSGASDPSAITGAGVYGYSSNGTANFLGYGVYGETALTGNGASVASYGIYGKSNNTGSTNSGLAVGVFGTAASAGNGSNAAIGGIFSTTGATGNRFALVASGGGDVYLGSSDAARPAALTSGLSPTVLSSGNTNTTNMYNARISGSEIYVGATSGTVTITANSSTTTYPLTLPAAQATIANQVLTNNGSGGLSWSNVTSYGTVASANAGINIPANTTVVTITNGGANAAFNYTLPAGANGQFLFIHNGSGQQANNALVNVANGTAVHFVYAGGGWIRAI